MPHARSERPGKRLAASNLAQRRVGSNPRFIRVPFTPAVLEFAGLTNLSARREMLWHLSRVSCRSPRRTTHKPVAGGNRPPGICPRHANVWQGWSRRAAPTNGPAVAVQSSTPAAVQPPPRLSCPALRGSRPAGDTVPLQKTSRLFRLLFELPRRANRGQPPAGRGSRGQMRDGQDTTCGG